MHNDLHQSLKRLPPYTNAVDACNAASDLGVTTSPIYVPDVGWYALSAEIRRPNGTTDRIAMGGGKLALLSRLGAP